MAIVFGLGSLLTACGEKETEEIVLEETEETEETTEETTEDGRNDRRYGC